MPAAASALWSLPLLVALLTAPAVGALAQQQGAAPRPSRLGEHGSWTAATHMENGQKVCYAFARPTRSEPDRQDVMLTVTHRPGQRGAVVLSPGYAYPRGVEVKVSVGGGTTLGFYTAGATAAARDSAAALRAFRNGREAVARGPGPNGRGTATDAFPLAGFGAALDAIDRECPPPTGRQRR